MTDLEKEMAQGFYGYGRWDAPYWFIGPEQGQDKKENDELQHRANAWSECGKPALADLKEFHDHLEKGLHTREKAALRPTWRRLIMLLKSYQGEQTEDKEILRTYQRSRWGVTNCDGETCVIELSGLPARNSSIARERKAFLGQRRDVIADLIGFHKPIFVLMYGAMQREHWQYVAGSGLDMDRVRIIGSTAFLYTKHPARDGRPDIHWKKLGRDLCVATDNRTSKPKI